MLLFSKVSSDIFEVERHISLLFHTHLKEVIGLPNGYFSEKNLSVMSRKNTLSATPQNIPQDTIWSIYSVKFLLNLD